MLDRLKAWFTAPYANTSLSPVDYFMVVGLLLVVMVLWGMILRTFRELTE